MPVPRPAAPLVVVALGALLALSSALPGIGLAQPAPGASPVASPGASPAATTAFVGEPLIRATLEEVPRAPAFVRLLRITLEPGASIPRRFHPGPKLDRVEAGTLTVTAEGPTSITTADDAASVDAPVNEAFELTEGQTLALPRETTYAFENLGDEAVELLTSVILPAGHQRPPGISYPDGEPPEDAYAGVSNVVLGDGVADLFPAAPVVFGVERLTLAAGEAVPAFPGPVMISLVEGDVRVTVDAGLVQVSRTQSPGPQRSSDPGESYDLGTADALYFPAGMAQVPRAEADGELTVLRLTLTSTDPSAPATPAPIDPDAAGVVTFAAAGAGATPEAGGEEGADGIGADASPAAEGDATVPPEEAAEDEVDATVVAEATDEVAPNTGEITVGSTVQTTDVDVNVRDSPSTAGAVVATLGEGTRLVVTGPPEEGDGFVWYPVQALDDATIVGYVAELFLELV
ncbi:MAG: hypothetical protein AVDCRST_MAG49-4470 [uncultured Thermomicrobiales bacterium]|uniref:SH3b domain-containing protein n=1 Tax=uncultured Thermomicrobiales bacterium TaxID=1645740 RepID=A0A6J4VHW8_9BACT|nr:MAG: hypothetical protein AVDCRST_MAG49-4470 [uncultured Thermomicrobiales bacterium]